MNKLCVVLMLVVATVASAADVRQFQLVDKSGLTMGGGYGERTLVPAERAAPNGAEKATAWTTSEKITLGVVVTVASLALLASIVFAVVKSASGIGGFMGSLHFG